MKIECIGLLWQISRMHSMLIPVFFVGVWCVWHRVKILSATVKMLSGTLTYALIRGFSSKKVRIKAILLSFGLLSLLLSMLHPQKHNSEHLVKHQGRDLFIALDISRSMLAADCAPNRLTCAKQKIKRLVSLLTCERIGLLLFSGTAFVQCPLTSDFDAFFMFLDAVDVETISSGTTALDMALNRVVDTYHTMAERKNKIVVLCTDGEDFSHDLNQVKQRAQQENLHIFALGIGTGDGAPIPLYDTSGAITGHQKDDQGRVVISRLNEDMLKNLAHDVSGEYVALSSDDTDIKAIMQCISRFEKEELGDHAVSQGEEQYPYFVGLGLICFLIEWLL